MTGLDDLNNKYFVTKSEENKEITASAESTSVCKYCYNYIYWIRQSNGRFKPYNLDYTEHHCPEYEIARATGQTALRGYYKE